MVQDPNVESRVSVCAGTVFLFRVGHLVLLSDSCREISSSSSSSRFDPDCTSVQQWVEEEEEGDEEKMQTLFYRQLECVK